MDLFPFNGAVLIGSKHDYLLSCYVMRIGTILVNFFGSVNAVYNWNIFARQESFEEIADTFIGESFPVVNDYHSPYWVPSSAVKLVSLASETHAPLVCSYGSLITAVPFVWFSRANPTYQSLGFFAPTSELLSHERVAWLPRPSNLINGTFLRADMFIGSGIQLDYISPITPYSPIPFEVVPPALSKSQIEEMLLNANAQLEALRKFFINGYIGAGSLRGSSGGFYNPNSPSGYDNFYFEEFLGGSTWVLYGDSLMDWNTMPTWWSSVLSRIEPFYGFLYSPIVFVAQAREYLPGVRVRCLDFFVTKELCNAINSILGFEAIKEDGLKVFGLWPVGSISFNHPFLTEPIWLPQLCAIEGWWEFDRTNLITGAKPFRLRVEKAIPIPTYTVLWYAKTRKAYNLGSVWVKTSWQRNEYPGAWDIVTYWYWEGSVLIVPVYIARKMELLPPIYSYDSLIRDLADIVRKVASKRVWVIASGLNTPFIFYNGTEGLLWRATGHIGLEFGPRSPVWASQHWYPHVFFYSRTYERNGAREAFGSSVMLSITTGSYVRDPYAFLQYLTWTRDWRVSTRIMRTDDGWYATFPARYEDIVSLSQFGGDPKGWYAFMRAAYYAGLPIYDLIGTHRLILSPSNMIVERRVDPPFVTAACEIKIVEHDNTKTLLAVTSFDTDFSQWLNFYILNQDLFIPLHPDTEFWFAQPFMTGPVQLYDIDTGIDDSQPMVPLIGVSFLAKTLLAIFAPTLGALPLSCFFTSLHYTRKTGGRMLNPDLGTQVAVGLLLEMDNAKVQKLPDWLTVLKATYDPITRLFGVLPLQGYAHAHPAHFTQLGREVYLGSILAISGSYNAIIFDHPNMPANGSFILNTEFSELPIVVLTRGIDPLYLSARIYSLSELPPNPTYEDEVRYYLSKPPEYWDPYLRSYESNFLKLNESIPFSLSTKVLLDLKNFITGTTFPVAIGNPFHWVSVGWDWARLPKFGWPSYLLFLIYWPLPWDLFYHEILSHPKFAPQPLDVAETRVTYDFTHVTHKPFSYFHGISPSELEKLLGSLRLPPVREVLPMVANIRTKAGVPATVLPFGIKFPHRFIAFPHIGPEVVCFHVNAYPLIDGQIVAHIYTGSGVHTYIVDGVKIVEHVFDPLPLHALEVLKLRR